jgi:hypothetical protein
VVRKTVSKIRGISCAKSATRAPPRSIKTWIGNSGRWSLAAQRTVAIATEKLETSRDGTPGPQTSEALNHVSWSALFARASGEALKASERAHTLAPTSLVIETNLAHALLFLGRSREAWKIYLAQRLGVFARVEELLRSLLKLADLFPEAAARQVDQGLGRVDCLPVLARTVELVDFP